MRGHGLKVHGALSQTTLANLAHLAGEPYEGYGLLSPPTSSWFRPCSFAVIRLRDCPSRKSRSTFKSADYGPDLLQRYKSEAEHVHGHRNKLRLLSRFKSQ